MFKKYLALLVAVLMTLSLAACAGSDGGAPAAPAGDGNAAGGEETAGDAGDDTPMPSGDGLTILSTDDLVEGGGLHKLAEAYTEETGVQTNMMEIPYDDAESKILNMIKAGNSPGVVRYSKFSIYADFLVDLTDIAPLWRICC